MQMCVDWILGVITVEATLWILYFLLISLLVAPAGYFLYFGWPRRKQEFLNSMSDVAAANYLRVFHGSEYPEKSKKVAAWAAGVSRAASRALTAQERTDTSPTPAGEVAPSAPMKPGARQRYEKVMVGTREIFAEFFNREFARHRFALPLALLFSLAACLLYICLLAAVRWVRQGSMDGTDVRLDVLIGLLRAWGFVPSATVMIVPVPVSAVLAILGGFTWVIFDLIARAGRNELTPIDVLWSSFRLAIAVPAAYAIAAVLSPTLSLPAAYLLGTLPTGAIMSLGRRALARAIPDPDAPPNALSQVQHLIAVDTVTADRLAAEGITTFADLASADPVRLSIRTGLSFGVTVTLVSEALLGMHLADKELLKKARKYGLCGAIECGNLWAVLTAGTADDQKMAGRILDFLAMELNNNAVNTSAEGLRNILREIAADSRTEFLRECRRTTGTKSGPPSSAR